MEEVWKAVLSDFDAVWRRVQGREENAAGGAESAETAVLLRRFLQAESAGEAYYTQMAKLAQGRDADVLRGMAAACGRGRRALRTELYLRTGENIPPERGQYFPDGYLGHIRRAYQQEGELAGAYLAASAQTAEPNLRELFAALSADAAARREKLYGLAKQILI